MEILFLYLSLALPSNPKQWIQPGQALNLFNAEEIKRRAEL
jgi:hypothetical protein